MITVTSADAQNRFGELLDRAQREPIAVTRHGRTVAYVIAAGDLQDPAALAQRRNDAASWYNSYRQNAGPSAAASALTDEDVNVLVHETR